MKRIVRRIVTVVTTETWSVVEDEEHELAGYTSKWNLIEQSTSDTPASSDGAHEESGTEVSDREEGQENGGNLR